MYTKNMYIYSEMFSKCFPCFPKILRYDYVESSGPAGPTKEGWNLASKYTDFLPKEDNLYFDTLFRDENTNK